MNTNLSRRAAATILPVVLLLWLALLGACGEKQASSQSAPAAQQQSASPALQSSQQQSLKKGLDAYHEHDYSLAYKLLKPLAEAGVSEAQRHLGVMYRHGLGVNRDDSQAIRWYRAAAEQGHVRAQNNLGIMYLFGLGTKPDRKQAEHWLRAAAQQNDAKAQENLGILYSKRGQLDDAVHYLRLAAAQDQVRAQMNLGLLYLAGKGVAKDEQQGMAWISKAAQGGSLAAAQALSLAYRDGLYGFEVDKAQADFWAARAIGN